MNAHNILVIDLMCHSSARSGSRMIYVRILNVALVMSLESNGWRHKVAYHGD